MLITCGPSYERGCSDGGDPIEAFKWIHQNGIPGETCHNYEAKDLTCNSAAVCQDCTGPWGPFGAGCRGREKFPVYTIAEYGSLDPKGNISDPKVIDDMVLRMTAEIVARGPIVCQIVCPDPGPGGHNGYLDDYQPFYNAYGPPYAPYVLYNKNYTCPNGDWDACTDHNVVVSGFGAEKQADGSTLPYWIVRNSHAAPIRRAQSENACLTHASDKPRKSVTVACRYEIRGESGESHRDYRSVHNPRMLA